MSRRATDSPTRDRREPPDRSASGNDAPPTPRPNLSGDLDVVLGPTLPTFRTAIHGYDRLQVDNYVWWAESELLVAHRQTDDLMSRHEQCAAELEIARRLLVHSREGQELTRISERIATMLQLAADEATARTEEATVEAQRIVSEARVDADAQLRRAHEIKENSIAEGQRMLESARSDRAQAAALVDRARADVERLLREAIAERDSLAARAGEERRRLDDEAAQERARAATEEAERVRQERQAARREQEALESAARERLAVVQRELDHLLARRDQARSALYAISEQIDAAMAALDQSQPRQPSPVPKQEVHAAS